MRGAERVFDSSACGRIFILNEKKKKKEKEGIKLGFTKRKKKKVEKNKKLLQ